MFDETIKLILNLGRSAADLQEARQEAEKLKPAVEAVAAAEDKLGTASTKASGGVAGMGQSMLQTGRVVQDFTQGGLGGILNNIEGLTMALGLGPGLAGVLTVVGVGFLLLKKPFAEFIESMGGGTTSAEHQAAAIDKLKEAGEKLKTQLGELAVAHDLSVRKLRAENEEMERSVKVAEARAKAQQRAFDEQTKREVAAAGMEGEPTLGQKTRLPSEKGRAEEIKKMVGGDPEAAIIKERIGLMIQNRPGANVLSQQARDADRDKVLGDFYAGQAEALETVLKALRSEGGREGEGPLRAGLEQLTPAAQGARRGRNIMETLRESARRSQAKIADEAAKRVERDRARQNREVPEAEATAAEGVREITEAERRDRGAAASAATREAAARAERNRLKLPSAAKLRQGDEALWQQEAVGIQQRVAQQGGASQAQMQRLQRLGEKLGSDMPNMQEALAVGQMTTGQLVTNQATFLQQLQQARALLAESRKIGQQAQQPMANNGWN